MLRRLFITLVFVSSFNSYLFAEFQPLDTTGAYEGWQNVIGDMISRDIDQQRALAYQEQYRRMALEYDYQMRLAREAQIRQIEYDNQRRLDDTYKIQKIFDEEIIRQNGLEQLLLQLIQDAGNDERKLYLIYKTYIFDLYKFIDFIKDQQAHTINYWCTLLNNQFPLTWLENANKQFQKYEDKMSDDLLILQNLFNVKCKNLFDFYSIQNERLLCDGAKSAGEKYGWIFNYSISNIIEEFYRDSDNFDGTFNLKIKEAIDDFKSKMSTYTIYSKYLNVSGSKCNKGGSFLVTDVDDGQATVLYLSQLKGNYAIEGKVPLSELEKRTSWKKGNEKFFK